MEKKDWQNGGTIKITYRGIFTRSRDKLFSKTHFLSPYVALFLAYILLIFSESTFAGKRNSDT